MPGISHTVFFIGSAIILTAGSVFVMWLAELMTERGIGNGGSLLIFVGIISRIPFYCEKQDNWLQMILLYNWDYFYCLQFSLQL